MTYFHSRWTVLIPLFLIYLSAACTGGDTVDDRIIPVGGQPAEAPAAGADLPAELQSRLDAYLAAWNRDDPAALDAFFTEDATAVANDSTYSGRDALRRWATNAVPVVSNLTANTETVERRGEDYHVTGTHSYSLSPPGEAVQQIRGSNRTTWTRAADGSWRIQRTEIQDQPGGPAA